MKKYPSLKFLLSQKEEVNTFVNFLKESETTFKKRDMEWAFFNPHPSLRVLKNSKLPSNIQKEIVKKYIQGFYSKNKEIIKSKTLSIKNKWGEHKELFYQLVDKIFNNYPWPKGKYCAYPTIWGMYARDVKKKTFQFPYNHPQKNYPLIVIAHEMLHFIFYDYFIKKYPQYNKKKYSFYIWHISEIFNGIIQNSFPWLKIFKITGQSYPEHQKIIKHLKKKYYTLPEAEKIILDILNLLKEKN